MVRSRLLVFLGAAFFLGLAAVLAADGANEGPKFPLVANVKSGVTTDVSVTLEVGGDLLVKSGNAAEVKVPMSVAARFGYREQILAWPANLAEPSRSLRKYSEAHATLKRENGEERELPADRRVIVAELAADGYGMSGLDQPLSRDQFDLVGDVVGNTLAIDRLLPNRAPGRRRRLGSRRRGDRRFSRDGSGSHVRGSERGDRRGESPGKDPHGRHGPRDRRRRGDRDGTASCVYLRSDGRSNYKAKPGH